MALMSTVATGVPGAAASNTFTLPELPSDGLPGNVNLSGGSGHRFVALGSGNRSVTPGGNITGSIGPPPASPPLPPVPPVLAVLPPTPPLPAAAPPAPPAPLGSPPPPAAPALPAVPSAPPAPLPPVVSTPETPLLPALLTVPPVPARAPPLPASPEVEDSASLHAPRSEATHTKARARTITPWLLPSRAARQQSTPSRRFFATSAIL